MKTLTLPDDEMQDVIDCLLSQFREAREQVERHAGKRGLTKAIKDQAVRFWLNIQEGSAARLRDAILQTGIFPIQRLMTDEREYLGLD